MDGAHSALTGRSWADGVSSDQPAGSGGGGQDQEVQAGGCRLPAETQHRHTLVSGWSQPCTRGRSQSDLHRHGQDGPPVSPQLTDGEQARDGGQQSSRHADLWIGGRSSAQNPSGHRTHAESAPCEARRGGAAGPRTGGGEPVSSKEPSGEFRTTSIGLD